MALRVKFGLNPYGNRLRCARCRKEYVGGGLWLRLEEGGMVVDMPLCQPCLDARHLYETVVAFDSHDPSHPVSLA